MKILKPALLDDVIASWVRSEMHKNNIKVTDNYYRIIEEPNLGDDQENEVRRELLKRIRPELIDLIPHNIEWYSVEIHDEDEKNLYFSPIDERWGVVTEDTYQVDKISRYFNLGDSDPDPGDDPNILQSVGGIVGGRFLEIFDKGRRQSLLQEPIILLGVSYMGPYTILEGNMRASYLVSRRKLHGYGAYLGRAPEVKVCPLSIDRYWESLNR